MSARRLVPRGVSTLSVECVVFGFDGKGLSIVLIPSGANWSLPGDLLKPASHLSLESAAMRALSEQTGLKDVYLEQLFTFSSQPIITVAYYSLVKKNAVKDGSWFGLGKLPKLMPGQNEIVRTAIERIKGKLRYEPVGFELLAPKFTLSQLQYLYEVVLERTLDKRNFRKKILSMDLLVELEEFQEDVPHRAPRLYRFDAKKYGKLRKKGFNFEI